MIDLTRSPYSPVGLLTVLHFDHANSRPKKPRWRCKCVCGNIVSHLGQSIRKEAVYSCGCQRRPKVSGTKKSPKNHPWGYDTRYLDKYLRIPWVRAWVKT